MWGKQYATERDRRLDVVWGGWLFVGLNIPLAILVWQYGSTGSTTYMWWQASPWVVQVIVLGAMLLRRPPMIIGYLAGFALTLLFPILLVILFLVGCFAGAAVGYPIEYLVGFGSGISLVFWVLGLCVIMGLIFFGILLNNAIQSWLNESIAEAEPWPRPKTWVAPPDIDWDEDIPAGKGENNEGNH